MAAVDRWSGREVCLLRAALRLSVRGFAEYLGVAVRTVSKWEQYGAARYPRPEFQAMLDTALFQATDEQRARFTGAVGADRPEKESATDRRQFVLGAAAFGATALMAGLPRMTSAQAAELAATLDDVRGHDQADLVPYFSRRLAEYQQRDAQAGPASVVMPTLSLVAAADITAHRLDRPIRDDLLQIAARGAEFVGWLYRDAGVPDLATYWRDRAIEWAQEACDGPLQGYVLLKKSQSAWDDRDGGRMLALAQAALGGPWSMSSRVQADALQQEARGLAMTGGSAVVVQAKLDDARQALDQAQQGTGDEVGSHYTEALFQVQTAMCLAVLGNAAEAVAAFDAGLQPRAFSRRDTAYFTTLQASALVAADEPDEAARLGVSLVEVASSTGSARTGRELERLLEQLGPWQDRPVVKDFREAVGV